MHLEFVTKCMQNRAKQNCCFKYDSNLLSHWCLRFLAKQLGNMPSLKGHPVAFPGFMKRKDQDHWVAFLKIVKKCWLNFEKRKGRFCAISPKCHPSQMMPAAIAPFASLYCTAPLVRYIPEPQWRIPSRKEQQTWNHIWRKLSIKFVYRQRNHTVRDSIACNSATNK